MDTKGGKLQGCGGGGGLSWAIGIDMYTLMCIKWLTNKNLLYKKFFLIIDLVIIWKFFYHERVVSG